MGAASCRWVGLGVVAALVGCSDDAQVSADAETSSGSTSGTSDDDGDSSDGGESGDAEPELGPPIMCGEIVADECITAAAVAIDTAGRFVLGGAQMGPQLRVVDSDGGTTWQDELGQRGGYAGVAALPDDRIVGVGATGTLSSGEVAGFARGYNGEGDVEWARELELGSSFDTVLWWAAVERLVIAAQRSSGNELWLLDADGALLGAASLEAGAIIEDLAPLGTGFVACGGGTLFQMGSDFTLVRQVDASAWSCASLASSGDRLALVATTGELVVLDEELEVQWSAPVIAGVWSYAAFHRENIVVSVYGGGAVPVTLQWFSPSGDALWTLEHPSTTALLFAGQLTVDGDRLWINTTELEDDGCLRTHLACVAHEE